MVRIISRHRTETDILIAGAGPAGASLAVHLCRMGCHVTLIDARTFPRDKICGDFVGPVALKELEALGIAGQFEGANRINSAALFLDGKMLIEQKFPEIDGYKGYGKVIPRKMLDEKIFRAAIAAGAHVIENCRLEDLSVSPSHAEARCIHNGNRIRITCGMIAGADGANSTVARLMHGKKYSRGSRIIAVRAYYRDTGGPADRADLFFNEKGFPGYYWLFPAGGGMANAGIGMVMETVPGREMHLTSMLGELAGTDTALHSRLEGSSPEGKTEAWPLPVFNPAAGCAGDRLLLIGDAGGTVNALNGEGIQYALLSGRWASETIGHAIDNNDFSKPVLDGFRKRLNREIGYDLALSGAIIALIRNRSLNPLWLEMLKVIVQRASIDPSYAKTAGGVLAGAAPASQALRPDFIAKTLFQAGIHYGIKGAQIITGGPHRWKAFAGGALGTGSELAGDIAGDPESYLRWAGGSVREIARLARYTVNDILSADK